jgi:hypothetical protein
MIFLIFLLLYIWAIGGSFWWIVFGEDLSDKASAKQTKRIILFLSGPLIITCVLWELMKPKNIKIGERIVNKLDSFFLKKD